MDFIEKDPKGGEYHSLDWSQEYVAAISGDFNDPNYRVERIAA